MKRKPSQKEFTYTWVFETIDSDVSFCQKRMFGGLAAYFQGRMVMVLVENPGESAYRGKEYGFDIWDGILFPTEKIYQDSLRCEFRGLISHPVLGKWLYLPAKDSKFETQALKLAGAIAAGDERLGIYPKIK